MKEKNFYQRAYSVSMNDMMEIWIESFHPFGTVLVIWDSGRHFEILRQCGVLINLTENYNNKAVTVELPGILEAYELMDNIQEEEIHPIMQVFHQGKLVSDNIEP